MRRTDDGIDPLEVADGRTTSISLRNLQDQIYKNSNNFFFVLKFYVPG